MNMIEIRHAGGFYVFNPAEIVRNLPSEVLKAALRRGKAFQRSRTQARREARGEGLRALKRDQMFTGSGWVP